MLKKIHRLLKGHSKARRVSGKQALFSRVADPVRTLANDLTASAFQEVLGLKPASFNFDSTLPPEVDAFYDRFAPAVLDVGSARKYEKAAHEWVQETLPVVGGKQEFLDLELEGLRLGPLIYDSYLRYNAAHTIELSDPRLFRCAREAARILYACADYLDHNDVEAVFPDHTVYNKSGILAQLAWERGIPVYCYRFFQPFYLYRIPPPLRETGGLQVCYQHSFDRYPDLFAQLSPSQRTEGRSRARAALRDHLTGKKNNLIFGGHTAYGEVRSHQVLADTGRPRVLVLLHDFCDAPHVFGDFLFPDFYEWIHHLLTKAQETEFDWYVKPHPNLQSHGRQKMGRTNHRVLDELKGAYPKVRFLDPSISNLQIIQEGVSSMFTVYGTAGHEFAYLQIPVVNAGPNRHMRYRFNLNPVSVAEYDRHIARADRLDLVPDRAEIEDFYYMSYFYLYDTCGADFEIVPPPLLASERRDDLAKWSALSELEAAKSPALEAQFTNYVRNFCRPHSPCSGKPLAACS